jgi:hypothetical protein
MAVQPATTQQNTMATEIAKQLSNALKAGTEKNGGGQAAAVAAAQSILQDNKDLLVSTIGQKGFDNLKNDVTLLNADATNTGGGSSANFSKTYSAFVTDLNNAGIQVDTSADDNRGLGHYDAGTLKTDALGSGGASPPPEASKPASGAPATDSQNKMADSIAQNLATVLKDGGAGDHGGQSEALELARTTLTQHSALLSSTLGDDGYKKLLTDVDSLKSNLEKGGSSADFSKLYTSFVTDLNNAGIQVDTASDSGKGQGHYDSGTIRPGNPAAAPPAADAPPAPPPADASTPAAPNAPVAKQVEPKAVGDTNKYPGQSFSEADINAAVSANPPDTAGLGRMLSSFSGATGNVDWTNGKDIPASKDLLKAVTDDLAAGTIDKGKLASDLAKFTSNGIKADSTYAKTYDKLVDGILTATKLTGTKADMRGKAYAGDDKANLQISLAAPKDTIDSLAQSKDYAGFANQLKTWGDAVTSASSDGKFWNGKGSPKKLAALTDALTAYSKDQSLNNRDAVNTAMRDFSADSLRGTANGAGGPKAAQLSDGLNRILDGISISLSGDTSKNTRGQK